MASKDSGKQVDWKALGSAIGKTPMKGKTPEQWAGQVWDKANGKGGNR